MDKDRYRPRQIEDEAVSLVNEEPEFRDREGATVLRRWPKIPLRAVLADTLAQTQSLLARLEGGVYGATRSEQ
jgi:hypothetical protein